MPLSLSEAIKYFRRYIEKRRNLKLENYSENDRLFSIRNVDHWEVYQREDKFRFFYIRFHTDYAAIQKFLYTGKKNGKPSIPLDKIRVKYSDLGKKDVKKLVSLINECIRNDSMEFTHFPLRTMIEKKEFIPNFDPENIFYRARSKRGMPYLKKVFYEKMIESVKEKVNFEGKTLKISNSPVEVKYNENLDGFGAIKSIDFKFGFENVKFQLNMPVGKTRDAQEIFDSLINRLSEKNVTRERIIALMGRFSEMFPNMTFKIAHESFKEMRRDILSDSDDSLSFDSQESISFDSQESLADSQESSSSSNSSKKRKSSRK